MQRANDGEGAVRARVNYFDPGVGRGRFDLIEPERNLMPFDGHEITIRDMRAAALPASLDAHGFTLSRQAYTLF